MSRVQAVQERALPGQVVQSGASRSKGECTQLLTPLLHYRRYRRLLPLPAAACRRHRLLLLHVPALFRRLAVSTSCPLQGLCGTASARAGRRWAGPQAPVTAVGAALLR